MEVFDVVPILNVTDVEASMVWFEKLGFARGFEWTNAPGEPVSFGAVCAGEKEIFLCLDGQGGRGEHGVWLSIFVDDVDAVHELCQREGIDVTQPPDDKPWGVREMLVRHPDGHRFRIGRGLDED